MKSTGVPTLLGIPFDGCSSYLRGAGEAPAKIREAVRCEASNSWTELGVDLGMAGAYGDEGDLEFSEKNAFEVIEAGVGTAIDEGKQPVSLGGDHSITFPIVKAVARRHQELTIFHFDAHPDLYDAFEGNRLSQACPFARIMEAGLARRLVQIGIRTMNRHQREQAQRFGVEVVEMRALRLRKIKRGGAGVCDIRYGCAGSGVCAGRVASGTRWDLGAGGDRASACDRRRDRGRGFGGVQPGAGCGGCDGDRGGEDFEGDFGEDDCGLTTEDTEDTEETALLVESSRGRQNSWTTKLRAFSTGPRSR